MQGRRCRVQNSGTECKKTARQNGQSRTSIWSKKHSLPVVSCEIFTFFFGDQNLVAVAGRCGRCGLPDGPRCVQLFPGRPLRILRRRWADQGV